MGTSGPTPPDQGASDSPTEPHPGAIPDARPPQSRLQFTTTRPVAVLMVFLAVIVFGGFSIRLLPLNLMPDISYPRLTVRTEYPGAAPAEVENNVSRPVEEFLGVVTGLTRVESVSRAGYSDVILEFAWDTDMDEANQDVLEKLDAVESNLPDGVEQPLILRYDPTLDPVMTLSIGGEGSRYEGVAGLKLLRRIADRDVRRVLEPIEGVAAIKVKGGLEEEIEIDLDEGQLRRTQIGIDTISARLAAENINLAGGEMEDGRTRYLVRTVNEFTDLGEIEDIVIVRREQRDVRLRDLASVRFGYQDRDVITRINGAEAVEVEVFKEADANIVEMAGRVKSRIESGLAEELENQFGASITVASDRSGFIESSISEVRNTALVGGGLAIVVLFLFLRDMRSTLIVAVAIPVSVLVTFAPLNLAGVSLNIMSLGGLALGVGMLVDNSIVVLESIHRCREEGDELLAATVRGTSEVGAAVFSSTLTSVAVFFPMVFVEGVAGQMFGDLGLAVVFSLLASLAVALFLIPMLASRTAPSVVRDETTSEGVGPVRRALRRLVQFGAVAELRESVQAMRRRYLRILLLPYVLLRFVLQVAFELLGKLIVVGLAAVLIPGVFVVRGLVALLRPLARPVLGGFGRGIGGIERAYPFVIRWCLRHRVFVYLLCAGLAGVTIRGVTSLDTVLIPELHQGEFTVEATLPVGTPLAATDAIMAPLEQRVLADVPHRRNVTATIGSERDSVEAGERGEHTAHLRVTLQSGSESAGLAERLGLSGGARARAEQNETEALGVVRSIFDPVPDLAINVARPALFSFKTPVEVEVRGFELGELADATAAVTAALRGIAGLRDVKASIQPGSPEVHIVYDRDELARRGLDIRNVAELVRDKIQGTEATRFNRRDRKIPVRVRLAGAQQADIERLRSVVVNPGQERPVPLSAVAKLEVGRGPNEIRRIDQQRVGIVTANVEGVGLGTAATRISDTLADVRLPEGVETMVAGQSEEWETSSRSLYLALGLSVFLVYVIMASQFESLIYPLLILFTIPLAFVGVVGTLWWLEIPLSVVVFLGAIMLAGIVVNNAIVLVDYVGQLKRRGHPTEEALALAGRVRLRPILMTTMTTVLGLLPMALGLGDGAEIRTPMAITVIAGLSFSTLLTLIVIPTLYAGIDRIKGGGVQGGPAAALRRELAEVRAEQLVPEETSGDGDDRP